MRVECIEIFANPNSGSVMEAVDTVRAEVEQRGIRCLMGGDMDGGNPEADIMLAMGGDGTILMAAVGAASRSLPILGVNLGRIGFLSEIGLAELGTALDAIRAGEFRLDKCTMLSCSINGREPFHCLNEAVLYRKRFSGVASINVNINGIDAGSVSCDGLIVSTPTGATGYSISAGGPVIAPNTDVAIITPICPHTLSFRPIITAADSTVRLSMKDEGFVAMDGIYTERILPGDEIVINRSSRTASFFRFTTRNLYSLIRNKLS